MHENSFFTPAGCKNTVKNALKTDPDAQNTIKPMVSGRFFQGFPGISKSEMHESYTI